LGVRAGGSRAAGPGRAGGRRAGAGEVQGVNCVPAKLLAQGGEKALTCDSPS